jgi:hypothetical protein
MRHLFAAIGFLCLFIGLSHAQRLDRSQVGERVLAIVPMVGTGTYEDPRRPAFVPSPSEAASAERDGYREEGKGLVSFAYETSDDGRFALVEFVAREPEALRDVLEDEGGRVVRAFRKGVDARADIETEFRKYKRDFRLDRFARPAGSTAEGSR